MTASKIVMSAASGAAGGAGLDVDEVFSTFLYEGNGSTKTITNGIDLSGEGGLVWIKDRTRSSGADHALVDTERGANYWLMSSSTSAQFQVTGALTSFNSNGFSQNNNHAETNLSGEDFVSWTFRKAPKFFDVVTYSGTGSAQSINHSLGQSPGMIIVKRTSGTSDWRVYHRGVNSGTQPYNWSLKLNDTAAQGFGAIWNTQAPTSTQFFLSGDTDTNASGSTYVAYLFAHNDGDGEFGPSSDQDIIKCGVYTGNGSSTGPTVNLGFEPQWLLIKNTSASSNWTLFDKMRGLGVATINVGWRDLNPNNTNAEAEGRALGVTATGFKIVDDHAEINGSGNTYIYVAIRRGPLAEPTSASDVFAIATAQNQDPRYTSGFPVDLGIHKKATTSGNWTLSSRLIQGKLLRTNTTDAEGVSASQMFDYNTGWFVQNSADSDRYSWMWKRAPGYFDVLCYTGTGSAHAEPHNLGVKPEMMWVKCRNTTLNWSVYHKYTTATDLLRLNLTNATQTVSSVWNDTEPTSTQFTVGTSGTTNDNTNTYIAYLFATVAGVSKVGSTSHTGGASTDVDCGFSNGAKFVLAKRTDGIGDWFVWDSVRGIVSGNDPYLLLNSDAAEVTSYDYIDPLSSGFSFSSSMNTGSYIFYAVA